MYMGMSGVRGVQIQRAATSGKGRVVERDDELVLRRGNGAGEHRVLYDSSNHSSFLPPLSQERHGEV